MRRLAAAAGSRFLVRPVLEIGSVTPRESGNREILAGRLMDSSKRTAMAARWLALALVLTVALPRAAWAHAHLVKSTPGANAHLATSPRMLQFWFSEAAEASMTTIVLTGPGGTRASLGGVGADAGNPLLLTATIDAPLTAGRYTVTWRTVAKDDGHPSNGSFSFVIDSAVPAAAGTIANSDTTASAHQMRNDSVSVAHEASSPVSGMNVEAPSYVLARWLNFVALLVAIGAAAFALLVVPRVGERNDADEVAEFGRRATQRAARLGLVAGIVFLIAAIWRLYAEHAVIGGDVGMGTLLSAFWGRVWIAQFVVGVIVCIAFAAARTARRGSWIWLITGIVVVVLAVTPAFSGHAIAAPGNRVVSVALDAIHVIAAGGWLGGLLVLAIVGVPTALSTGSGDGNGGVSLVSRLVNAFSPMALVFAGFVAASGVVAGWMRVGSFAGLFHSTYGTVLLIKLAFVALVLAGGAFNWRRMRRALAQETAGQPAVGSFRRSAWFELIAGVLVIAATAILVATPPPVH